MRSAPNTARGFSLIELMVVVAIIGVIAAIAFPAYDSYVGRTNRAVAKSLLSQLASKQEQYFANNKEYATTVKDLGMGEDKVGINNRSDEVDSGATDAIYVLLISDATTRTYTIEAVPVGAQAGRDADCGTLTINQAGTKTASGGGTGCW